MYRIQSWLRWMTAIALIVFLALLAWACIDIYIKGSSANSAGESGDVLFQMYRWDDVQQRLSALWWPFGLLVLISSVTAWIHQINMDSTASIPMQNRKGSCLYKEGKNDRAIRNGLYVLALVFILLGVMNGGMHDVLVKAINICTECIGLG